MNRSLPSNDADPATTPRDAPAAPAAPATPAGAAPPPAADPIGPQPPAGSAEELRLGRTRTSSLFVAAVAGLVLALLMLIFVLQNGDSQDLEFLWMDFRVPTGITMLLAAITGGLVVALLGLGRVLQLRLAARRHRASDRRAHVTG